MVTRLDRFTQGRADRIQVYVGAAGQHRRLVEQSRRPVAFFEEPSGGLVFMVAQPPPSHFGVVPPRDHVGAIAEDHVKLVRQDSDGQQFAPVLGDTGVMPKKPRCWMSRTLPSDEAKHLRTVREQTWTMLTSAGPMTSQR